MGLFTDIYNTVAKFFRQSDEPIAGEASKAVATNRLKLVLMQDRTNLTPKVLEQMRSELVDLLSKYLEMDKELLELNFEQEGDQVALMLSIPVIRAKDEEEIEEAIKAQQEAKEAEFSEEDDEEVSEDEDNEEIEADEDNSEENNSENSSEDTPKPKKRRSKKVTTPEDLEVKSDDSEISNEEIVEEQSEITEQIEG